MSSRIGVIGAGAWGTAVAKVIADKGNEVVVWSHEKETAEEINLRHSNERYLPGVSLPASLSSVTDPVQAADGMEFLILATPSLFLLDSLKRILHVSSIREGETAIGVITKGFIPTAKGPRLILETLEDYLPGFYRQSLVYIAGPSHAEEVSRGLITGLIAASESAKNSFRFRDLMKTGRLLVFSSLDVRGVQVAAAAKNVIAIAFGMLDALSEFSPSVGDNTESLLLAAGLNEIQRLGLAMGATHAETFSSIAGVGDLDVTCRSKYGRNRRFGREIILTHLLERFRNIDELIANIASLGYLPEGILAAKYTRILAEQYGVNLPMCSLVHAVLDRRTEPLAVVDLILKQQ